MKYIPKLFTTLEDLKKPEAGKDFYAKCAAGHETHSNTVVGVELSGQPKNQSAPAIPSRLKTSLAMRIYDWREYFMTVDGNETWPEFDGYCPGQDIISYCIDQQGVWEGDETLVILDILSENNTEDVVLDFGSHIGYYSMLAARNGYQVASIDSQSENLDMLKDSAVMNNLQDKVHTYLGWLDEDAPTLSAKLEGVQLVKVDVEGNENSAVAICNPLFVKRKIKYAIIEVSPVFNESYPELVSWILSNGYDVYQLPGNNWEHNSEFTEAPLDTIKKYCEVKQRGEELAAHINSFSQENFLFVRRDG